MSPMSLIDRPTGKCALTSYQQVFLTKNGHSYSDRWEGPLYLGLRHVILPIIIGFPIFPESDVRLVDPREKSISGEKCVGRYSRLT